MNYIFIQKFFLIVPLLFLASLPHYNLTKSVDFIPNSEKHETANEWKFWKSQNGVSVYFRNSEGSNIKEVKMTTTFYNRLSTIVEAIKDVQAYPKWVYKASGSYVVLKYDDNDVVYYNYFDFPWPMQDRDAVIQSRISQDPNTLIVTSVSHAKWEAVEMKQNVVRIQDFRSKWTFSLDWEAMKKGENKVYGEYVFKSNPGGEIPSWMINLSLDEGPLKTIKNFKNLLLQDKYKNAKNGIIDAK